MVEDFHVQQFASLHNGTRYKTMLLFQKPVGQILFDARQSFIRYLPDCTKKNFP